MAIIYSNVQKTVRKSDFGCTHHSRMTIQIFDLILLFHAPIFNYGKCIFFQSPDFELVRFRVLQNIDIKNMNIMVIGQYPWNHQFQIKRQKLEEEVKET